MFLPPNTTSEYQPLDQGIINNWKTNVKKQFVFFMAKTFDEGKNLSEEMHVLRAIRWGVQAWECDVTPTTIQACWRRSQCLNYGVFPCTENPWTESEEALDQIRQGLNDLKSRGFIQSLPNLKDYVSPYSGPWNERVDDTGEVDELVDNIIQEQTQQEVDLEAEEGEVLAEPLSLPTDNDALISLHTLRRYEEAYRWSDGELLRVLRSFERDLAQRVQDKKEQATLDMLWGRE
jgi:DDE superfamily endonuclease